MNIKQPLLQETSCCFESEANSTSFIDVVRNHSINKPNSPAFIFLKNGETTDRLLTFAALDEYARAVAALLQRHLTKSQRAILLLPSGLNFIIALLGCLYAGIIAVPVIPPHRKQGLEKLLGIVENCDAKLVLTEEILRANLPVDEFSTLNDLKIFSIDNYDTQFIAATASNWRPTHLDPSSVAFLQYTSGSTDKPKGIPVTHKNLLAVQQMLEIGLSNNNKSIYVSWLPLHHDMGLVGNVLQSLFLGVVCVLMPPVAFVQQPIRWLQAISKYKATTAGAPNFAYDLCVRRVSPEQMKTLDLSSWRVAFNGAEPVRAETLDRFSEKFSQVGFSKTSFYPCYGMAEATLFVSGPTAEEGFLVKNVSADALLRNEIIVIEDGKNSESVQKIVGCGKGREDQVIRIVDPDLKQLCKDRTIGEIWIKGSNVVSGYWNSPIATAENFGAYILNSNEGPFLRTGDLGFIDEDQLFITGRRKELIIIKGQNLYPHDVEKAISVSHSLLEGGDSAAFSIVVDGEEKLVIVHETRKYSLAIEAYKTILMNARSVIANKFDVHLFDFVLVKRRSIPKTTSGKIQRNLCKERYLKHTLCFLEKSEIKENTPISS